MTGISDDRELWGQMARMMGESIRKRSVVELPSMLVIHFPQRAAQMTADFITQYALALFMAVASLPSEMLALMALGAHFAPLVGQQLSILDTAMDLLDESPESCTASFVVGKLREGMDYAPSLRNAVTEQVVTDAARFFLYDVLRQDPINYHTLEHKTHVYFEMALQLNGGRPSLEQLDKEVEAFLASGDYGDMPPEQVEEMRQAREDWLKRQG